MTTAYRTAPMRVGGRNSAKPLSMDKGFLTNDELVG